VSLIDSETSTAVRISGGCGNSLAADLSSIDDALETRIHRTAVCGPACTMLWQGRRGDPSPSADFDGRMPAFTAAADPVELEQLRKNLRAFLLHRLQGRRIESQGLQNGWSYLHGCDRDGYSVSPDAGI
jgi:hypothetical protein